MQQHTLKLQLKTITPVSVGGDKGDTLSPYVDYIFSEDKTKLHYLNLRKLGKAVAEAGLLETYVQGIRAGMDNNRSSFNLEKDILANLPQDNFITHTVPQFGLDTGTKQITPAVKNAGQPYVPGSSLKGAIRTAILYDWLVNTESGKKELKHIVPKIEALSKIREELFRIKKDKDWRRDRSKSKQVGDLEKEAKNLEKSIFEEEKLFGSLKSEFGPDARFIRVSDSQPADALQIHALRRIRIVPGEGKRAADIPQTLECIAAQTTLDFEISILPEFANAALSYWKSGKFDAIFAVLNQFSKACIENEIRELGDALELNLPAKVKEEVEALLWFYQSLQKHAADGAILLRLGFGKTVNDNSLLLALINGLEATDRQAIHDFRSAFHKVFRKDAFFPITRAITHLGEPMGWISINIHNLKTS